MKKRILVTGSNGMLGGKLIQRLIQTTEYDVLALAGSEEKFQTMLEKNQIADRDRVQFLPNEHLLQADLGDLYGAVHLAFSRRNRPAADIAGSIDFSADVFRKLAASSVKRVINLSSQGVYGDTEEMRTENTAPAPITSYTMAKYATEKIFDFCFEGSGKEYTNLRLDLVVQSQNLVIALCKQAKDGIIHLRGGEQRFSFIDADDAVMGIIAMLNSPTGWDKVYNVGWNCKRYKLPEVAEIVADVAENAGYRRPEIVLEQQDIKLWAGMNSEKFMKHTGWKPEIDLPEMAKKIFEVC